VYSHAVQGRWHMEKAIPTGISGVMVRDAGDVGAARDQCTLLFSAVSPDKQAVRILEEQYAAAGFAVVSANSAHRSTPDVPVLIPEINPEHLQLIPLQRARNGWQKGLIAAKPSCSLQSYMTPLYALVKAGYPLDKVIVTTLQGISGSGYPGNSAFDLLDNTLPLPGEEVKSEQEPLKILGTPGAAGIELAHDVIISAHCNRVAVVHGHSACVSFSLKGPRPDTTEIIRIWETFRALPQEAELPFAPRQPLIYRREENRPQPHLDRDADKGMSITLGRLRECPVLDYKFNGLSHNVIRGAAGGAILIAELLQNQGFLELSYIIFILTGPLVNPGSGFFLLIFKRWTRFGRDQ